MTAGYLFIIISWLAVLLIATDWLDPLFAKRDKLRHSKQIAVIILLLILLLQGLYIEVVHYVYLNVGSFVLICILALFYYWIFAKEYSLQIMSIVTFLGIFYAVAYELFFLDPVLMVISPQYLLPCLLMLFIVITIYQLPIQLLVLAGGFLLGETLHKVFMFKHVQPIYLGDAFFRDQLVIGFILVILTNGFFHLCKELYIKMRKYYLIWLSKRKNPNEQDTLQTR